MWAIEGWNGTCIMNDVGIYQTARTNWTQALVSAQFPGRCSNTSLVLNNRRSYLRYFIWSIFYPKKGGLTMKSIPVILLGHFLIIGGCYLVTWGLYLLPVSVPTPAGILSRPFFWGLILIFGGVCTIKNSVRS